MLESISTLVLATSVRVSIGVDTLVSSVSRSAPEPVAGITPRCDWVAATRQGGTDPVQTFIENLYGLVLTYLPLIVIGGVILVGVTIMFAVRKKVIGAVIPGVFALIFLGAIVAAVGNIGMASPCG